MANWNVRWPWKGIPEWADSLNEGTPKDEIVVHPGTMCACVRVCAHECACACVHVSMFMLPCITYTHIHIGLGALGPKKGLYSAWAKSGISLTTLVTGDSSPCLWLYFWGLTSSGCWLSCVLPLWFPFLVFFPCVIVLSTFSFFTIIWVFFFSFLHSVRGFFPTLGDLFCSLACQMWNKRNC